jgi:hypothetical protein
MEPPLLMALLKCGPLVLVLLRPLPLTHHPALLRWMVKRLQRLLIFSLQALCHLDETLIL